MSQYPKQQTVSFSASAGSSPGSKVTLQRGVLITLEGDDLAGKTTHAGILSQNLKNSGYSVTTSREPGGTLLGESLRELLKRSDSPPITPLAEALLFAASRSQLCETVVIPALKSKSIVVLDRFTDSSLAYQGYGKNLDLETIRKLNDIATSGILPDMTFLLESVSDELNDELRRSSEDRFESESISFRNRVKFGYSEIAKKSNRWISVPRGEIQETADFILGEAVKRVERIQRKLFD